VSGALPLKAQCLPFSRIPHSTPLFRDFLRNDPKTQAFYPHSARFGEWFKDAASQLKYDPERRKQVADILESQNKSWGASPQTFDNLTRFRNGACAFVTGQQVGLFGGPLFTILKALTATKLAEQATRAGVDCVPIFWLASEDHDLDEVNHVFLPSPDYTLQKIISPTQGAPESQVGQIAFGPEIAETVAAAAKLLGDSEIAQLLREIYRPGATFGNAFAKLFAKLFANWGLIILDGSAAELRSIAEPVFQAAIERAEELNDKLISRGKALEAAGYHQQVKVAPSSTLLFAIQNGARTPIHMRMNGEHSEGFSIGSEKISRTELLKRIVASPKDFSPNVLLRPIVQDYLLPTVAYAGGPSEVAYFAQTGVVYEALAGQTTAIVPRLSATLIPNKAQVLLDKHKLAFTDVLISAADLREKISREALPQELLSAFEKAFKDLDTSISGIKTALQNLDPTLVTATATSKSKMRHQLEQLQGKAARAQLVCDEIIGRHADLLSMLLYPEKDLQERVIGGALFLSKYPDLLTRLYAALEIDCVDHQLIAFPA
jgi:bacillithiol synthase